MASERENILDKVVDILASSLTGVRSVSRKIKDLNSYTSLELPAVVVMGGDETRRYNGNRMIATFQVLVRIITNEDGVEKSLSVLNDIISQVETTLENNKCLDGLSILPLQITHIETDEGWMFPFSLATIFVETYYSRIRQ